MKPFAAFARVSGREQEREGFSLDVQVDGIDCFAVREHITIARWFRVVETATKSQERRVFEELLDYCRKNAQKLGGLLFYKVDRAARNMIDWGELKRGSVENLQAERLRIIRL